jgi:hypothetical protein
MERIRLTGSKTLPAGAHVNVQAAGCFDAAGNLVSGVCAGETFEVDTIEHPERLEAAVARGDLVMEKIGPAMKMAKKAQES